MTKKYECLASGDYIRLQRLEYYSPRYKKTSFTEVGYISDGATWAVDIDSEGWWVHDGLKEFKVWSDGSKCSNWQASWVLYDILRAEGHTIRKVTWLITTLLWGTIAGGFKKLFYLSH